MRAASVVDVSSDSVTVRLPRSGVALRAEDALGVVSYGPEAVTLIREGAAEMGHFAGELKTLTVGEVMGIICTGLRSGKLIVTHGALRKTVSFRAGQVTFASSTEPYERLGRSLVTRGHITSAQLAEALPQVSQTERIGQVLVRIGALTPAALYAEMAALVRSIVLGLFALESGHFMFLEGEGGGGDAVRLPGRTRDLMLEGMRQAGELARLKRRFPPMRRLIATTASPTSDIAALLQDAVAGAEVLALRARFEGGDYDFWVMLERLVVEGALQELEAQPAPSVSGPTPSSISSAGGADLYASLLRTICTALRNIGSSLEHIRMYLAQPADGLEGAFDGVALSDSGDLDIARVLENARRTSANTAIAQATAYEALDSFVSYALFSARNALPPELAALLQDELKRIHDGL